MRSYEAELAVLRELVEATEGVLGFPLALQPYCGEAEGDLEIAIGRAADALSFARELLAMKDAGDDAHL